LRRIHRLSRCLGPAQESGWDLEHVKQAMEIDPDNARVNLAIPIPVLLVYGPAVVQEDGEVYFYPDIYGLDARLAEVVKKGYPYP
jgi:murein L,D-transpeptidase YcbB/YkuD